MEAILDACGRVLDAGTTDALSITSVAAEADIPAASVYDYFLDSRALLAAYVARCFEQNSEALGAFFAPAESAADALENVRLVLVAYCELYATNTAFRTAIAASQADDELLSISVEDSKRNARLLQEMLRPFTKPEQAQVLSDRSLIAVHMSGAFARLIRVSPPHEAERLIQTYIDAFVADIVKI